MFPEISLKKTGKGKGAERRNFEECIRLHFTVFLHICQMTVESVDIKIRETCFVKKLIMQNQQNVVDNTGNCDML